MKTIFWYSVLSSFIHNSVVSATQGILHCPEQLGGDIQACVAKLCGGQDSKNGGHCINKVANQPACSCSLNNRNQTAIAGPALTTVVATHSGKAVTATYALATLTSYSNLRQSITTTVTLAPTASDAPAATAAVAVFAGGVAWYLAALVGEEAAATIIKPPSDAGDHPDDKTCPSNKHSCSDCAGTLGICVTPDGGCACENKKCPDKKPSCSAKGCAGVNKKCTLGDVKDCACEDTCPTGDKQPKCSHPECKGGDDKKCTVENKGCECKEDECPTDPSEMPFCANCGGEDKNNKGKCLGIKDKDDMLKGCECYEEIPDRSLPYQNPVDYQAVGNWFKNIKPAEKPVCTKQDSRFSETYAPQKKKDGANSVEEKAEEFCSKMDGKTVVQAPDGIDTEFSYTELSKAAGAMWLSASIRYNSPSEKCGKSAKISKRDCINSLTKAMTTCEPNSAKTHGAALASGCIFYNITMDMSTDPNSPPWNRKARTSCDLKDVSDIQNNFLTGLYPSFCDAIKKDPTQALERTFTNTDFKNPSKRSHILNKRTPPVNNNNYPGYKFNFKWTGGDNCRMDCTEAYSSMLKDTCGHQGAQSNLVTTKASRDAGCGIYSWEVIHPPPVTCEKNKANPFAIEASKTECKWEDNCLARPQSYPKSAFLAAAHQMCYGGYDWTAKPTGKDDMAIWWQTGNYFWFDTKNIDPDTNLPAHCGGSSIGDINQWSPDSRKYCKSGPGFKNSDSKIFLTITPSKDQEGCEKLQDYNLPTKGDCEKIFASVADTCITDPNDKEQTGGFYHEKASTGCWDWWIWGIHLT